jgi:hypothetical protein
MYAVNILRCLVSILQGLREKETIVLKILECKERKLAILSIADKMASAASAMNAQNYDTLIEARNSLVSLCDKWEKEDESMINSVDCIKVQINTLFSNKVVDNPVF